MVFINGAFSKPLSGYSLAIPINFSLAVCTCGQPTATGVIPNSTCPPITSINACAGPLYITASILLLGTPKLSVRYSTANLCPPPPMAIAIGRVLFLIASANSFGVLMLLFGLAQNVNGLRAILATGSKL